MPVTILENGPCCRREALFVYQENDRQPEKSGVVVIWKASLCTWRRLRVIHIRHEQLGNVQSEVMCIIHLITRIHQPQLHATYSITPTPACDPFTIRTSISWNKCLWRGASGRALTSLLTHLDERWSKWVQQWPHPITNTRDLKTSSRIVGTDP